MYRILYADNPWEYDDQNTGGTMSSGASQQYATLTLDEIKQLPVRSIMGPAAVCFLWVPTPLKFSHGGPTLDAWGFRYVTTAYWEKIPGPPGMGRYFRGDFEELLVGVSHGVKPFGCQLRNKIAHPRRWKLENGEWCPHSSKPEAFRRLIEAATGEPSSRRNLELFGRRRVPGWTVLGNEIDGLDIRDAIRAEAARLYGKHLLRLIDRARTDQLGVGAADGNPAGDLSRSVDDDCGRGGRRDDRALPCPSET